MMTPISTRHDWQLTEVLALYAKPFNDLLFKAHTVHRESFNPNAVQVSQLLSIKTGGCPEDCGYCPQSAHHPVDAERENLLSVEQVIQNAKAAKANGASRFCMGAAWRNPQGKSFLRVLDMIKAVKALGLETCATLGMLTDEQAKALEEAGLDYYNHNLDTSPEYYPNIISTRTYQDRLDTLAQIRKTNIHVCCGGIIGMGESREDRAGLLTQLANLPQHPESVPINQLSPVKGTPLGEIDAFDRIEFVRTIAIARIMMPCSMVRLSAGRDKMSESLQALCIFAGANSIFYGEKLFLTANPESKSDHELFQTLGISPMPESQIPNSPAAH